MMATILQRIKVRYILIVFLLLGLAFITTHGIFIIESDQPVLVSLSKDSAATAFKGELGRRHIKVTQLGKWYVAAQKGERMTGVVAQSRPFLIPTTLKLNPKPQRSTQKLSSVGNRCLLYDNPAADVTISSTCNQGSQTLAKITGDANQQPITSIGNIIKTSPSAKGFVYVLQAPYTEERFSIGEVNASTSVVTPYFTGQISTTPQLVKNSETGLTDGVIMNQRYVTLSNLARGSTNGKQLSKSDDIVVAYSQDSALVTLNGANPERFEGDTDESSVDKPQTIRSYVAASGSLRSETAVDAKFFVRDIKILKDKTIAMVGESIKDNYPVLCFTNQTFYCQPIWGSREPARSLVLIEDQLLYLADGAVWRYSQASKQSEVVYKVDGFDVQDIQVVNGRVYISTRPANASSDLPYSLYQLLLDSQFSGAVRLDAMLPDGEDGSFINHHRGVVIGYSFDRSLTKNKILATLRNLGLSSEQLSSLQIQLLTPKVDPPVNRIVIDFPNPGE